ncbi:hypothetical protein K3F48_23240, partial [Methylosinus sp. Sm6]|nr:hypothetical protein [Methylosinus sp. Sm6]
MRATVLIEELHQRGIHVYVRDGRLRCAAPAGALTTEIRDALHTHHATILAALSQERHQPTIEILARRGAVDLAVSFAQQRLLFLDRLTPGDTTYNISAALRLFGDVDFGAVVAALNEIVRRHDVLRTRFVAREGEARQEVLDRLELAPSLIDLGAL